MDIITTLEHRRGTKINVNGKHWDIDKQGCIHDIDEESAKKLLQSATWLPKDAPGLAADTHAARSQDAKAARQKRIQDAMAKSKIQLADGSFVSKEELAKAQAADEAKKAAQEALQKAQEPDEDDSTPADEPAEPVAGNSAPMEASEEKWPEPGSEEYPDPDESLPIETLRRMADDYGIEYGPRTQAKTLVTKLEEVMYGDDDEEE